MGMELLVTEPISVLKDLKDSPYGLNSKGAEEYRKCPANIKYLHNTFVFKALIDITINKHVSEEGDVYISIPELKQEEYDQLISISHYDKEHQLIQLNWNWLLFSDTDVEVTQLPVSMHVTDFNKSTLGAGAVMNISKWFRPIKPAFFMLNDSVRIKAGYPLFYIKVHTKERVELVEFEYTYEHKKLAEACTNVKKYKYRLPLKTLYSLFKGRGMKSKILKLIKNNLR